MSSNIKVNRICEYCKQEFVARTTKTKYCTHKCNSRAYKANIKGLKIEISNIETKLTIEKPIEDLKQKAFLSINETSKLLGISRRTIYRLIERGELKINKIGNRTILQRSEIDKMFN